MERNCIYHGDCLEVLKTFPENSIDLIITSPPYNYGGFPRNTAGQKTKAYNEYEDDLPDHLYKMFINRVLKALARVLKPGGTLYWNHKGKFHDKAYLAPHWVIEDFHGQV